MTATELNEESKRTIDVLRQWIRSQRETFARDLEFQYEQYKDCRVLDATYSKTEVEDMLHGLFLITQASIHQESTKVSDGFVAYMCAVLREAQRSHVPLHVGTDVLDWVASGGGGGGVGDDTVDGGSARLLEQRATSRVMLSPLGTRDTTTASSASSDASTTTTIAHLNDKIRKVTEMYSAVQQEQSLLQQENARLREAVQAATCGDAASSAHTQKLMKEIGELKKELSTRLSSSTQFLNLKRMMMDKNVMLRDLRSRLSKYEALEDGSEDETQAS